MQQAAPSSSQRSKFSSNASLTASNSGLRRPEIARALAKSLVTLFPSRLDYSSAFVSVLAVFQARSVLVRAFPFCAASWTGRLVFVAPDF
jgi:hypothetical protein